jgi:hypothetical protein
VDLRWFTKTKHINMYIDFIYIYIYWCNLNLVYKIIHFNLLYSLNVLKTLFFFFRILSSIVTLAVFPFRSDATCAKLYERLTAQGSEELTGCLKIEKPMRSIEISEIIYVI